jgi:Sulfotransferase family
VSPAGGPPLPNFVIVGAMRSGSTSLYKYLQVHPQVWMPRKEIHFFDKRWDNGLDWYRDRFAGWSGQPAVGEATPTYLAETEALDRMAATIPDAKLVAILRDPVDRAYSHYWMEHVRGRDDRPFAAAAADYLGRGRYLPQLEAASARFGRDDVAVVLLDDLRSSPGDTYAEVCAFLGVDPAFRPPRLGERVNRFVAFRSMRVRDARRRLPKALRIGRIVGKLNAVEGDYPPLDPALAARLRAGMASDNEALAAWLGRDLSAWGP